MTVDDAGLGSIPRPARIRGSRVLIIDPDSFTADQTRDALEGTGVEIEWEPTGEAGLVAIGAGGIGLLILELKLSDLDGLSVLRSVVTHEIGMPVVIVTADDTLESAVSALREGAFDYVVKRPDYGPRLVHIIRQLLPGMAPSRSPRPLAVREDAAIVGVSQAITTVRRLIHAYARTDSTVLISGETGTGKELVAIAIHLQSRRATNAFVPVNCAALPESLFESEFFGTLRGAYTGATHDRRGIVAEANGGTRFLDEIGELALTAQAKLLRLLESGLYRPLGATRESRVDLRVIAASNRDLRQLVAEGRCREDLYYRLNILRIEVPPLRDRRVDIPLLTRHFLNRHAPPGASPEVTREAMAQLIGAPWRGNVRELEHVILRTLARSVDGGVARFDVEDDAPVGPADARRRHVARDTLVEALLRHCGRLSPVAEEFGISIRTVQRRVKEYRLLLRDFRGARRHVAS
jgi:DNA-binding NtrC family response regulator